MATIGGGPASARDILVSSDAELSQALRGAKRGDTVLLSPGTYKGDIYIENLDGVTIGSADAARLAVIEGGSRGMQLIAPVDVTLRSLVFARQRRNGLILDDAGQGKPARGIRIEHVTVRDIVEKGNNDGIKLAGVQDVVIRNVIVVNWGSGGSGIDFVGVHRALIEGAFLWHKGIGVGGSGIRVKGGSKAITIRGNRVELAAGRGRAIQAGGHTSPEYFRFADGDSGYEAANVVMEGNTIVGGASALSWVNIDGGIAHRNLVHLPGTWVIRILNENSGSAIVPTRNGRMHDNRIVFDDTIATFNSVINAGDDTLPRTFAFARNSWINLAKPTASGSRPRLPVVEADGSYGASPPPDANAAQVWDMPWGKWVINATASRLTVNVEVQGLSLATAGPSATFDPLDASPLRGQWTVSRSGPKLTLAPMSQTILVARPAQ